jgi:hypothetical protein
MSTCEAEEMSVERSIFATRDATFRYFIFLRILNVPLVRRDGYWLLYERFIDQ